MKDCDCMTHEGPHFLHMDAIWREKNRALLAQALAYHEQGMYALAANMLEYHGREEIQRLKEKETMLLKVSSIVKHDLSTGRKANFNDAPSRSSILCNVTQERGRA